MNIVEPGTGPIVSPGDPQPGYPVWKCAGCGMQTSVKPDRDCLGCGASFEEYHHVLGGLNATARRMLEEAGIPIQVFVDAGNSVYIEPGTEWLGDRCGCTDSRCIGFHHLSEDDCRCMPIQIEEFLKTGKLW